MFASSLKDEYESTFTHPSLNKNDKISTVAVIYGANSSGKTGIISALDLMRDHILYSHSQGIPERRIPNNPFKLDDKSINEETSFGIDFAIEELRYRYEFSYVDNYIINENLYSFTNGRKTKLFEREKQDFSFGRSLSGQNKLIASVTRGNSLFLSAAAQNDHKQLMQIFSFFEKITLSTNIKDLRLSKKRKLDDRAITFLNLIGTGIVDWRAKKIEMSKQNLKIKDKLVQLFTELSNDLQYKVEDNGDDEVILQFAHKARKGEKYFDISDESAGTQHLLRLLDPIFKTLDEGGILIIDEIDRSLHTQAVTAIIEMFLDKEFNKNHAQLICTVHDTNILNCKNLRRDQIWLAEKNADNGSSELFSIAEIKTRKGDNIEKAYTQGRYGGTPSGSVDLWLSLLKDHMKSSSKENTK
ncbi:ATP-binding protein [Parasaccharibacter sp. TMW 2.1884]|uniref:AAA family ATPase n=1 Tax=Parasaccharibacter sp. TMW 2.1884 TaxID=2267834 RepID=UPI00201380A2